METLQRDKTLDIAKGICIILMVIGHSGCPTYLNYFIYMFHMPCFFFISGWLLNDRYITDLKTGLIQKAKGSYYPFVKWTLIFLLFHNVFASMHIYENSYSWQTSMERIVRAFTMTGSEQLLGGFWFLISLFWASIISLLFLSTLSKHKIVTENKIRGGVILTLIIAMLWHYIPIALPQMFGEQTILATAFYLSGYLFKKKKMEFKPFYASLLIIPALFACFMHLAMDTEGWRVLVLYVIAMSAIGGVMSMSSIVARGKMAPILTYIGSKTLYILVFHFLAFKVVSSFVIQINCLPINELSHFPVLEHAICYLWIIYSLTGIGLPMLVWKLFHPKSMKV